VVLACWLVAGLAQAGQDDFVHPRRAWVVGPNLEAPAMLLSPQAAFVTVAGSFERVCAGQAGCAAVAHWEPTRQVYLPRGFVLRLEPALAVSVSPWPQDLHRQLEEARAMDADQALRPLARALRTFVHARLPVQRNPGLPDSLERKKAPERKAAWIQSGQGPWHWEVGLTVDPGIYSDFAEEGEDDGGVRFLYGGTLRAGFRYQTRVGSSSSSHNCIAALMDAVWEFMSGNQYGADLLLHVWREGDRNHFAIGVHPAVQLVWDDSGSNGTERIRTFAALGAAVPELGFTFDNHGDKAFYVRFLEPVAIMLTPDVALDIRVGGGFVIGAERGGVIGTLGLGLLFR